MLDERLISSINRGRCIAFIGSGPSCEAGYPSWATLARKTYEYLQQNNVAVDVQSYEKYLKRKQYPELFRQAERDAGGRDAVIDIIKPMMSPAVNGKGTIYEILAQWPFACYITTNYDDEISNHLEEVGVHFTTVRNQIEDFYNIRADMSHLIFKIHSDLEHPDGLVLTSADYHDFLVGSNRKYFRDKLRFIMENFDVFVLGHSLSDSDIQLVLRTAKETANPVHPIYMMLADCTHADEQELFESFNIRVTSYSNGAGNHAELRRSLNTADYFIVPRQKRPDIPLSLPSNEQTEAAVSMLVFRRLQEVRYRSDVTPTEYIGPLVLQALSKSPGQSVSAKALTSLTPLDSVMQNNAWDAISIIEQVLSDLEKQGYVTRSGDSYAISSEGVDAVEETRAVRLAEEEQAYGQFITDLKAKYVNLSAEQEQLAITSLRNAIVHVYQKRGLAIANTAFALQDMEPDDLSGLFQTLKSVTSEFAPDRELQACFLEASRQFIVQPTRPQRNYIMSLSQGYFLYHMVGKDPTCTRIRREIFRKTAWLCDANVLLPLFAAGSHNHEYAVDLFNRLNMLEASVFTTDKLLQETWEHLDWAIRLVGSSDDNPLSFYRAALVKGSYKQNLFIDGYIRQAAVGIVADFQEYLDLVCPLGCSLENFARQLEDWNITVVKLSKLDGFVQDDWGNVEETREQIRKEREARATYRSELQITAEAEVIQIVDALRSGQYHLADGVESPETYYFVSLSLILDRVEKRSKVITWRPEALYRYVTALPREQTNPDLLQQAMLHEYYYAGIVFIDERLYEKFFSHAIGSSRVSLAEQIEKLQKQTETIYAPDYDEAFENTPDLEKPFFAWQLEKRAAEQAEKDKKRAEREVARLQLQNTRLRIERDKALGDRADRHAEHEIRRQRNLLDPKRVKKLIRRRKRRQKKKRK